jgi:hypothetical protein
VLTVELNGSREERDRLRDEVKALQGQVRARACLPSWPAFHARLPLAADRPPPPPLQVAAAEAEASGERLKVGSIMQKIAHKEQQLEKAEETAEQMRQRLQLLNQTYLASGEPPRRRPPASAPTHASRLPPPPLASRPQAAEPLLHPALPAGDKLRGELASTKAELEAQQAAKEAALQAERSAKLELEAATESLRLNMGGMQQQLAVTTSELEKERASAADMKERLNKLNSAYISSSEPRLGGGWRCDAWRCDAWRCCLQQVAQRPWHPR